MNHGGAQFPITASLGRADCPHVGSLPLSALTRSVPTEKEGETKMASQKALVCPLWPGVELHKKASLGNQSTNALLAIPFYFYFLFLDILFTAMYNNLTH